MQLALKFEEDPQDTADGFETVIFHAQMLRDVYGHENEELPEFEEFLRTPRERKGEEKFWVYRQGTFFDSSKTYDNQLYVGHALIDELNQSEVTHEGYHHIPTLFLENGGRISFTAARYSSLGQRIHMLSLYTDIEKFKELINE